MKLAKVKITKGISDTHQKQNVTNLESLEDNGKILWLETDAQEIASTTPIQTIIAQYFQSLFRSSRGGRKITSPLDRELGDSDRMSISFELKFPWVDK